MGRRLRQAALVVVVVLLGLAAASAVTELPGPPVRDWLGLGDEGPLIACSYDEELVRSPAAPPPEPGRWRPEDDLPGEERPELDAVAVGDVVYVAGGQGWDGRPIPSHPLRTMVAFDAGTGSYAEAPSLPVALDHTLLVAHRGELYLAGGYAEAGPVAGFWRLDLATGRWTPLAAMRQARGALAGAVIGDRLYVVGGAPALPADDRVQPYATLEIFDFATGSWSVGPDMPTPRHHLAAAAVDGLLYVAGGRDRDDRALDAFERFDPETEQWERLAPLPQPVGASDAVATDGALLITGGDDEQGWRDGGGYVTPAVWAFLPDESRWRRLPDLDVARHAHAAAIAAGRIYIFGGTPCPGFGETRSVESLRVPADLGG